jgi:hypothetical protein
MGRLQEMNMNIPHRILYTLMAGSLLFVLSTLQGCTFVKYTNGTQSLTVIDARITGSAIDLSGTIEGVGSLDVNREQGSAEGIVDSVTSAVSPSPMD